MKKLGNILVGLFVGLVMFLGFSILGSQKTFAEEVDWTKVSFTQPKDADYQKNIVLFLGNECPACSALYLSIKQFDLEKYFTIQILDGHTEESKTLMRSILESKGINTTTLVVPVLVHNDFVGIGYSYCSSYIQAMDRVKGIEADYSRLQQVAREIYNEEKATAENKSILDVFKDFDWWVYAVIGSVVVLLIVIAVLYFRKKASFSTRGKMLLGIAQFVFFALMTAFLVIMVNSKRQYIPEQSLAGCIDDPNPGREGYLLCDTWEELVAQTAQEDADAGLSGTKSQQKADKIFGKNEWKDVNIGTQLGDSKNSTNTVIKNAYNNLASASQAALDAYAGGQSGCKKEGVIDWECVNEKVGALKISVNPDDLTPTTAKILQEVSPVDYIRLQLLKLNLPEPIIITQTPGVNDPPITQILDTNIPSTIADLLSCKGITSKACLANMEEFIKRFNNRTDTDFTLAIDPITKTIIKNPKGMSVIDDFCTITGKAEGSSNKSTGSLCKCVNPYGGYAYTRSDSSWATCDDVCAIRFPCDKPTCAPISPEPTYPPITPPTTPNTPYCGDGILGNTSGEQCEKGDPSGVSCSWSTCDSSCKCPAITEPYCGDGKVTTGEQCEVGDPTGTTCKWDTCNQVVCQCVAPNCGDGILGNTPGEKCERGDPNGVSCLWDTECNQLQCICDVSKSEFCGDGILQDGEKCELNNPTGTSCDWSVCSKSTCTCPAPVVPTRPGGSSPQTGIFDNSESLVIVGSVVLLLGLFFNPLVNLVSNTNRFLLGRNKDKMEKRFK